MPRTSALPSEVSSLGSAALCGTAGSVEGQVDRWPGQPPPLLSAQEGLGLLGFIKAFGGGGGGGGQEVDPFGPWIPQVGAPSRQGLSVYNPRLVRKGSSKEYWDSD